MTAISLLSRVSKKLTIPLFILWPKERASGRCRAPIAVEHLPGKSAQMGSSTRGAPSLGAGPDLDTSMVQLMSVERQIPLCGPQTCRSTRLAVRRITRPDLVRPSRTKAPTHGSSMKSASSKVMCRHYGSAVSFADEFARCRSQKKTGAGWRPFPCSGSALISRRPCRPR